MQIGHNKDTMKRTWSKVESKTTWIDIQYFHIILAYKTTETLTPIQLNIVNSH
jgi:hypothetical protein